MINEVYDHVVGFRMDKVGVSLIGKHTSEMRDKVCEYLGLGPEATPWQILEEIGLHIPTFWNSSMTLLTRRYAVYDPR